MDKAALMRAFKVMCAETGTRMSEKCKLAAAPLMGLKPIEIREAHIRSQQLAKEVCYDGRFVHANICASAKVGKRLVLCLVEGEDEDGAAAFLHVFNALKSNSKPEEAQALFPKDAKVAIKEPLCYCSIMHVSSPASLEFVGLAKKLKRRPVEDLIKEGNRLLSKGNFVLAEMYFTECINLFMSRDKSSFGDLEKEVFCSRSEARLKLGKYEEAFMDAELALKIDASHWKSLVSKGESLSALQEHRLALASFMSASAAVQTSLSSPSLDEMKNREVGFLTREYDISSYLLGGFDSDLVPECSDFVGPLELRMTPDGRGRGLYLTEDVKLGDLLLVCNPTAAITSSSEDDADEDLYVELVRACVNSDKRLRQIYAMADAEGMEETSPDMTPFKCDVGKVLQRPQNRVVDVERIRRVRDRVGYTSQSGGSYVPGLWPSVGLINHSCLPNASKIGIGKAVFVRAARDLKAGDEVLVSYLEPPLAPFGYREKIIKQYCFECKCERCKVERDYGGILGDLPYKEVAGDSLAFNVDDNVMDLVLDIERRIKVLREEEKNWVRGGFPDAYSAVCLLRDPRVPSLEQVVRMFREVGPGNKHTLSRIGFLCSISGRAAEAMKALDEEVTGIYGRQRPEVVDAVTRKYMVPSRMR